MSTKNNPGPFNCYEAAEPDEPMFILLGRDRHAAALVNMWVAMRALEPSPNSAKLLEALRCADEMVAYHDSVRPGADVAGIATLARALAALAERCGAVVTIDQVSRHPLRMGNYRHRVSVGVRYSPGPEL